MPERPRQYETGLTLAMSMLVLLCICEHFLRWSLNKWYRGQSCQKQLWKKCSRFPMTFTSRQSTVQWSKMELTLIRCYYYQSYSNFASCPNSFLFQGFNLRSHIAFGCYVSLASCNTGQSFFVSHGLDALLAACFVGLILVFPFSYL